MKSRGQLETETIEKYRKMAKKWGISEEEAENKAKSLLSSNSDADLRNFLKKPMKGLSINALDPAHAKADSELQKMAREINKVYSQAADTMESKINSYLEKFKEDDARMQDNLTNGLISDSDYKQWRQNKLMQTKQWEQLRNTLAEDASNANDLARSTIQGHMPEVYAENYNYGVYEVENGLKAATTFTLYDHQTVERLMRDNPKLLPDPKKGSKTAIAIAKNKDLKWNRNQIQAELLQGILLGESNQKIAKRMKNVTGKNYRSNMRYARTMTTAAENAGRIDSYDRAQDMGIDIQPTWMATLDGRTRDSHRALDGEKRDPKTGMFSNRCRFPGDPEGPGAEVWNCRCTLVASVKGFEKDFSDLSWRKSDKLNEMSYEEWKAGKKKAEKTSAKTELSVFDEVGYKPKRPRRTAFSDPEEYEKARQQYRSDRKKWESRVDNYIQKQIDAPRKYNSVEKFKAWADKNDIKVQKSVYENVDPAMYDNIVQTAKEMLKKYPQIRKNWDTGFQIRYENDHTYIAEASKGLTLGTCFKNAEDVYRQVIDGQSEGFFVSADGTFNSILRHEYGHMVDNAIRREKFSTLWIDDKIKSLYSNINTMDELNAAKAKEKEFHAEIKRRNEDRSQYRKELIDLTLKHTDSGATAEDAYRLTNEAEAFAEGFAEYQGNPDSDYGKDFGAFLKKWSKK